MAGHHGIHRETKRRPIDLYQEEKPYLLALPAHPYDTAETIYWTVNCEACISYRQNFYSVPWQRIGQLLPLRITEKELISYDLAIMEIARHELVPRGAAGERIHNDNLPGRDHQQKYELLKQRFAEFGAEGVSSLVLRTTAKDSTVREGGKPPEFWGFSSLIIAKISRVPWRGRLARRSKNT